MIDEKRLREIEDDPRGAHLDLNDFVALTAEVRRLRALTAEHDDAVRLLRQALTTMEGLRRVCEAAGLHGDGGNAGKPWPVVEAIRAWLREHDEGRQT